MNTFKDRLEKEEAELSARIEKLLDFLGNSERKQGIDPTQLALMEVQVRAMQTYAQCLNERITLLATTEAA